MRVGELGAMAVVLASATGVRVARADDLEASGFVGIGWFGEDTQLGNSWAPEQVPGTAPVVGARLGYTPLPHVLGGDSAHLALGIEGELAVATAFTGGSSFTGGERGRMSYFAPVFGWRVHAVARLAGIERVAPHLVVGVGGETVASSSPFMSKETDPELYWGPGVAIPVAPAWHMRVDLRHGLMPARGGGVNSTIELQLGVATTFGPPVRRAPRVEPAPAPVAQDDTDSDGDGIPDRLDRCPSQPETVNGIEDGDGCPEPDPDGDGILADADTCPDQAEDFDGFEDTDGCAERDNDRDGIDDPRDACPNTPESPNGWLDGDGCPDDVPATVTAALASAANVRFEAGRARLTRQADLALGAALAMLHDHPEVRVTIIGHPDRAGGDDLAKRRAEAVKWHLVDEGIVQDRVTTTIGATGKQSIEIVLALAAPQRQ